MGLGLSDTLQKLFCWRNNEFTKTEIRYLRRLLSINCEGPFDILVSSRLKKGKKLSASELHRLKVLTRADDVSRRLSSCLPRFYVELESKIVRMYRDLIGAERHGCC